MATFQYGLSDQAFKESFKDSPVGLVVMDLNGKFLEVNNAFRYMLGYSEEEILQLSVSLVTFPEDIQPSLVKIQRLISGEISCFLNEKRYLHRNGHSIWARSNVSLIKGNNGISKGLVAIVQNIDDIKKSESALKQAIQLKDHFLVSASHKLRTPITAMKLNAQMIKRQLRRDVDQQKILQKVERLTDLTDESINRMNRLIEDMLVV